MANLNTGTVYPATATSASLGAGESMAWTDPNYVIADDSNNAVITSQSFDSPTRSQSIYARGFDFSAVPDTAPVTGIVAQLGRFSNSASETMDFRIQLVGTAGAVVGSNYASVSRSWGASMATQSYGGTADVWGMGSTLTGAYIKNANFGLAFAGSAVDANAEARCNFIRLQVFYDYVATSSTYTYTGEATVGVTPSATRVEQAIRTSPAIVGCVSFATRALQIFRTSWKHK